MPLTMRRIKDNFVVTGPDIEPMEPRHGSKPRTGVGGTIRACRSQRRFYVNCINESENAVGPHMQMSQPPRLHASDANSAIRARVTPRASLEPHGRWLAVSWLPARDSFT